MYIKEDNLKKKGIPNSILPEDELLMEEEVSVEAPVELPKQSQGLASPTTITSPKGAVGSYIEEEEASPINVDEFALADDFDTAPDSMYQDSEEVEVDRSGEAYGGNTAQFEPSVDASSWFTSPDNNERDAYIKPFEFEEPSNGVRTLQALLAYGIAFLGSDGDVRAGMAGAQNYMRDLAQRSHVNSTSKYLYDSGYSNAEISKWVATGKLERNNDWKPTGDGYTVVNARTGEQRLLNRSKDGQVPMQLLKTDPDTGISTYKNPMNGQVKMVNADGQVITSQYYKDKENRKQSEKLELKESEALLRSEQREYDTQVRNEQRAEDKEARREDNSVTQAIKGSEKAEEDIAKNTATLTKAQATLDHLDTFTDDDIGKVEGLFNEYTPTITTEAKEANSKFGQLAGMVTSAGMETLRGLGAASDRDVAVITKAGSALFDDEGKLRKGLSANYIKSQLGTIRNTLTGVQARANEIVAKKGSEKSGYEDTIKSGGTSRASTSSSKASSKGEFVRTGTHNGRRVGQRADGSTVYLD